MTPLEVLGFARTILSSLSFLGKGTRQFFDNLEAIEVAEEVIGKKYGVRVHRRTVSNAPPPSHYGASNWPSTKVISDYSSMESLLKSICQRVGSFDEIRHSEREKVRDLVLVARILASEGLRKCKRFLRKREVAKNLAAILDGSDDVRRLAAVKIAIPKILGYS